MDLKRPDAGTHPRLVRDSDRQPSNTHTKQAPQGVSSPDICTVITVGASDPTAADGIQADLRTLAAFGVHGAAVITSVTGRSVGESPERFTLAADQVVAQFRAAIEFRGADAVKIGELGSAEIARAVASAITGSDLHHVVIDPVEVVSDGKDANKGSITDALKGELFPCAAVVTPNIEECKALTELPIKNPMGMKAAAKLIHRLGPSNVIVTGGQIDGPECTDYLFNGTEYFDFPSDRVEAELRGIGASFASAIAAGLARGRELEEAAAIAKMYVTEAAAHGFRANDATIFLNQQYGWLAAGGDQGYGG